MTSKFKKLAVAAGVSAGLAAMSMPSQAVITGAPGEALLVPLVVWAQGHPVVDVPGAPVYNANTLIQVTVPGSIGFDDVPNLFTAANTTPTNAGPVLFPDDADLSGGNTLHWYWFDHRSIHRLDRPVDVTANDTVTIDWQENASNRYEGEAGYMIIGTETARRSGAADFSFYGDAWLEVTVQGSTPATSPTQLTTIPVIPMTDGEDGPLGTAISVTDNVKYRGGIPVEASPLIGGMRTNRSDGTVDLTAFDLPYSTRANTATMQVVWMDRNLDDVDVDGSTLPLVPVDVYDSEENACSASIELANELNVIWVPWLNGDATPVAPYFAQTVENLCLAEADNVLEPGFVTYYLDEYVDNAVDAPETAGVAFSIFWEANDGLLGSFDNVDSFSMRTVMGHERGTFRVR